jgi:XTP/dITP diphosphohydrolase
LRLLSSVPAGQRQARFRCVLAVWATPRAFGEIVPVPSRVLTFEGICHGHIAFEPSGSGGFGYDPIFVPEGFDQSFAELGAEIKNCISHRAQALGLLRERLAGRRGQG